MPETPKETPNKSQSGGAAESAENERPLSVQPVFALPGVLPAVQINRRIAKVDGNYVVPNKAEFPELSKIDGKITTDDFESAVREIYAASLVLQNPKCKAALIGNSAEDFLEIRKGSKVPNTDVVGILSNTSVWLGEGKGKELYYALETQSKQTIQRLINRGIETEGLLIVGKPIFNFMYASDPTANDPQWLASRDARLPIGDPSIDEHKLRNPKLNARYVYLLGSDISGSSPFMPCGLALPREGFLSPKTDRGVPLYTHFVPNAQREREFARSYSRSNPISPVAAEGTWGPIKKLRFSTAPDAGVRLVTAKVSKA